MKKLLLLFICLLATFLSLKIFLFDLKTPETDPKEEIAVKEEQTVPEEKKEEPVISETKEEQPAENSALIENKTSDKKESDPNQIYRMLDFDRRLILSVGEQDSYRCSIYCLAYARAILDKDYKADPDDYWDGEGAVWRWAEFEDIALSDPLPTVLQRAYDEIDSGRPVILFVSGLYGYTVDSKPQARSSEDHYVLLIGYKADADYRNLKASDFYAADPSAGYRDMPWITLTDEAPATTSGEYALYASEDHRTRVPVCLAHADTSEWDDSRKKEILPDYVEESAENKEDKGC